MRLTYSDAKALVIGFCLAVLFALAASVGIVWFIGKADAAEPAKTCYCVSTEEFGP